MDSLPSQDTLHAAALALRTARAQQQTIKPISITYGITRLADAYDIAMINAQIRLEKGARILGKKVGLTSPAVQQQLGVDQPDFGFLFDDMEYLSGDIIPSATLVQPKAEAEIAFIVGHDLSQPKPSYSEFLASLSYALPAIEIVDSVITDWRIALADTVADNASCGLYVLGNQPVAIEDFMLDEVSMRMELNGDTVSTGNGAACLGHPLRAAYWLAQTMGQRGEGLRAGEVILSGALGPMATIQAGDHVEAYLGALGGVSCTLAGDNNE